MAGNGTPLVIDTNVILDMYVYEDPAVVALREWLESGQGLWHATPPMREELRRVLDYPHIARRLEQRGFSADEVLARFDRHARIAEPAPRAAYVCKDPDDQKFIDLAVVLGACLVSKDKAVLRMTGRLARRGVRVQRQWSSEATLAA